MSDGSPHIAELGHVGLRCFDLDQQVAFYRDVLGLTVTDKDEALGLYFLSSRPEIEHHEFVLTRDRVAPRGAKLIQQISFRCPELSDVIEYFKRFRDAGVEFHQIVSHGTAVSVYFFDPEGNRTEVYWATGLDARQPFVMNIDLDQSEEAILAEVSAAVEKHGKDGTVDPTFSQWAQSFATAPVESTPNS